MNIGGNSVPPRLNNPLRYPGAKTKLVGYVAMVLEANLLAGSTIHEPFGGSAAISLGLLRQGFVSRAVVVERDPLLFAFWNMVFENPDRLCRDINDIPVTLASWQALAPWRTVERPTSDNLAHLALAGIFFNRTNYSGIIGAGPIGGYGQTSKYPLGCRFNKQAVITSIRSLAPLRDRISIVFDDAYLYLRRNHKLLEEGSQFVYLDPPYYAHGRKYYRYYFEERQHSQLADYVVRQPFPWLLSYDDHPQIRTLYGRVAKYIIYMDYSARINRRAPELLISNLVIPPQLAAAAKRIFSAD